MHQKASIKIKKTATINASYVILVVGALGGRGGTARCRARRAGAALGRGRCREPAAAGSPAAVPRSRGLVRLIFSFQSAT